MGHRIPYHKNKCSFLHGHRYRLEVSISGEIRQEKDTSDEGMVLDFGDLKALLNKVIHDQLDHRFMISESDPFLNYINGIHEKYGLLIVPFVPTVENITKWCVDRISEKIPSYIHLTRVRLYETPNCWADYYPQK